jgi:phosphatidylserine decarboxylase
MQAKRVLLVQCAMLSFCGIALTELAVNFPYPSPLIKPFLPPRERWPTEQIMAQVDSRKFDWGFVDYFNRDPERTVPAGTDPVSPADGIVKGFEVVDGMTEFVVNLSFWDVHVVRTPVAGVVKSIEQGGSVFLRSFDEHEKAQLADDIALRGKDAPVQAIVTLATAKGDVRVRLITSYWASRLLIWVHEGQHLTKGERIGRILLGSTVAAEFPGKVTFSVRPDQRVVGGETIISQDEAFQ